MIILKTLHASSCHKPDLLPPFLTFDLHLGTRTLWQKPLQFNSTSFFSGNKNHQQQQHQQHQQQRQQRHVRRPPQLWRQQPQQQYQQLQLQRQIQLQLQEEEQHHQHTTTTDSQPHNKITSQSPDFQSKDLEPIIQEALPKPLNKIAFQVGAVVGLPTGETSFYLHSGVVFLRFFLKRSWMLKCRFTACFFAWFFSAVGFLFCAPLLFRWFWQLWAFWVYHILYSKVVSTHLWNTPLNLYQKAKRGFFHNWLGGLPGVCSRGVLKQPLIYWFFQPNIMYRCSKMPERIVLGVWAQKNTSNGRVLLKSRVTVTCYASTSILVIPCRTSRIFILSLTYSNLASNPCRETCGKTIVVGTCGKWLHFF